MALITPTTEQIATNIVAQLEQALSQTIPLLPKSFTRVLAKALAGVLVLVYRFAGFAFLQQFVTTASNEETTINGTTVRPLTEWGRTFGVGDPIPAQRAELVIDVTVINQVGSLAAGTQLVRTDTGVIYQVIAVTPLTSPVVSPTVRATSDPSGGGGAGEIGNLEDDDVISFANPLPNVETDATVASTAVTGLDAEATEAYRSRVLQRTQTPPQGGAYADYRIWGEGVAGVANIFPYTGQNPGEVDVYVEATTTIDPDGIPDTATLDAVADAIELNDAGLASRRPANAAINTLAITRTGFGVEVVGLAAPDIPATQAAVQQAVDDFLRAREPFIVGLSVLPRLDSITQGAVAGVVSEVVSANGGAISDVVLTLAAVPIPSYLLGEGELAKLIIPITWS